MVPQAHFEPRPASLARHSHHRPHTMNRSSTMACSKIKSSQHRIQAAGTEDRDALRHVGSVPRADPSQGGMHNKDPHPWPIGPMRGCPPQHLIF